MKPIISNDLMNRIKCAAANESIVAKTLLQAIKDCRDIANETNSTKNYFDSKRYVHGTGYTLDGDTAKVKAVRAVVTCCRKDVTNPNFPDYGNPQAPYFSENRNEISVQDFAKVFAAVRDANFDDLDWRYFDSAMRLPEKVKIRISDKMSDIQRAYTAMNYSGICESDTSTLHGSCMRHERTARNAADFYANFAGANIMIAETASGEIVGRAIVWPKVTIYGYENISDFSFIDRIYTSFDGFLLPMMVNAATTAGIAARKEENTYSNKRDFVLLRDVTDLGASGCAVRLKMMVDVPAIKMHKKGCPYIDTMSYLLYNESRKQLFMVNNYCDIRGSYQVAGLDNTGGAAARHAQICPVCGKVHGDHSYNGICDTCGGQLFATTPFGNVMVGRVAKYKGMTVPASFLERGKPTENFGLYLSLQRLFQA